MAKKKENLKDMNLEEKLISLRESIRAIRFDKSGAKTKNVKAIANFKKEIARILTEINKKK